MSRPKYNTRNLNVTVNYEAFSFVHAYSCVEAEAAYNVWGQFEDFYATIEKDLTLRASVYDDTFGRTTLGSNNSDIDKDLTLNNSSLSLYIYIYIGVQPLVNRAWAD